MFNLSAQPCASTEHIVSSMPFTPHRPSIWGRGIAAFYRWPLRGQLLGIRAPGISSMCLCKMGLTRLQSGNHKMPPAADTLPLRDPIPLPTICKKRQQHLLTGSLWTTGEKTHQASSTISGTQIGIKVCVVVVVFFI